MRTTNLTHRHLISLAIAAVAMICGTWTGTRLSSYGVPGPLYVACSAAVTGSLLHFLDTVAERFETTVYRCPAVDCTYKVRVSRADAAEQRRWQETAAAHPRHELNPR